MFFFQKRSLNRFQCFGWLAFSAACSAVCWLPSGVSADDMVLDITEAIHKYHLSRPPKQAIPAKSADGLNQFLKTLDPHSKYLTQKEYRRLKINETEGYCGIGAEVRRNKRDIVLIPFQGGSAYKAGVRQRQYLKRINGRTTQSMDLDEIKSAINGPKGSVISLGISHYHSGRYREVILTREKFVPPSVEMVTEEDMEYIRILQFIARRTVARLRVSIRHMIQKGRPIILDLRDSFGGDLYEAIDALSLFLPAGTLISRVEDSLGEKRSFYALPEQQIVYGRVLILVGPTTASAAELFVSVLKHYSRAVVIGQATYGKCTSQKYFELPDGSALKLTNLKIYYPNGAHCNGLGLKPDIRIVDKDLYQTDKLISEGIRRFESNNR